MATVVSHVSFARKPICHDLDVAIIGNGPSAIALSFMLSGNQPYYSGRSHPNEYLTAKLNEQSGTSLLEQDLDYLSEGLEGRSSNPVSLLFDQLLQPDADLGCDQASVLSWHRDKSRHVQHAVIGKGGIGGSWANMPPDLQSLSYAKWLELPGMPMRQWCSQRSTNLHGDASGDRSPCGLVAQYYAEYVKLQELEKNFCTGSTVVHVSRIKEENTAGRAPSPLSGACPSPSICCVAHSRSANSSEDESVSDESDDSQDSSPVCRFELDGMATPPSPRQLVERCVPTQPRFEVRGVCCNGQQFILTVKELVLAVGTADQPQRLDVPGEDLPIVSYGYPSPPLTESIKENVNGALPLVVVGCGLTAADCVLLALRMDMPVIHVFRRSPNHPQLAINRMPGSVYPEYAHVRRLMSSSHLSHDGSQLWRVGQEKYIPLAQHRVLRITDHGIVLVNDAQESICLRAGHIIIAAGRRPDLSFLNSSFPNLTLDQDEDFNYRTNPIDIDPFTFESRRVPGLYAVGPLVGDNFVRFAVGGALGVTKSLLSRQKP